MKQLQDRVDLIAAIIIVAAGVALGQVVFALLERLT